MAAGWTGGGAFNRLYSWVSDAAAGLDISSSRMDADTNLITSVGFGNCLTRDGQGAATGNLPMNGFHHTGAAPGTAAGQYLTWDQLQTPASLSITVSAVTTSGAATIGGALGVTGTTTLAVTNIGNTFTATSTSRLGTLNNLSGASAVLSVENPTGTAAQIMSSINSAGATSLVVRNDRNDGTAISFLFGASTQVGSITQNGSTTTYNTTSDQRLKVRVGRIEYLDAADVVEHIAALWFTWKAYPGQEPEPGFFAQQVYRVCPWAVTKGRGRVGSQNYRPWQMDASKLMPFVIAYIQGLGKRLDRLEKVGS